MNRLNLRAKCGLPGSVSVLILCFGAASLPVVADTFSFSTGNPDGRLATLSRPASGGVIQTETADDVILGNLTSITNATFTGLLPSGTSVSDITQVEIEFYHVFPADSANPPSGKVPTRMNSPGDVEIGSATRDSAGGTLTFSASVLSSSFTAANSIKTGINPSPNEHTGGEGDVTGEEVQINVNFSPGVVSSNGSSVSWPSI